jgi:lipoprotein-releasing system permease protein
MLSAFLRYFFGYIIKAKTRQRLLFLAILGLSISSFALLVLQSTMGGLQHKLINRSKAVTGSAELVLHKKDKSFMQEVKGHLEARGLKNIVPNYEIELMVKFGQFLSPVIVHGVDPKGYLPDFLKGRDFKEMVMPRDLARKVEVIQGDQVRLISPGHVDDLMRDVPRMASFTVDTLFSTNVTEVDAFHLWCDIFPVQNLIRKLHWNRLTLYQNFDPDELREGLNKKFGEDVTLKTWEQKNSTLVWALGLESTVMVFLFIAMTLLVGLCITSALMIFFGKIKTDLSSFWILGSSKDQLIRSSGSFLLLMGLLSVCLGLGLGLLLLGILDQGQWQIMPDVFVDREIPVHITVRGVLLSFFIPLGMGLAFCWPGLVHFRRETNFLEQVRSIGN